MLEHENKQIFERYFEGNNDTNGVGADTVSSRPFFVSGEKLRYVHVVSSSAGGIATTTFVGAANTTFLPGENLFAVGLVIILLRLRLVQVHSNQFHKLLN